jgi:hypothetical protein
MNKGLIVAMGIGIGVWTLALVWMDDRRRKR